MQDIENLEIEAMTVGRAAFVLTGPTSGLGLALYKELQRNASPVVAIGRSIVRLTHSAINNHGGGETCTLIEADFASVSQETWLESARIHVTRILAAYPEKMLVFLNNAGTIAPLCPATELDSAALNAAMQVNFAAPVALATMMVQVSRQMGRQLRIVNITTGAALRPIPGWLSYCASKTACRMALEVLIAENPEIELIHIDPGVINTGMQELIRQKGHIAGQIIFPTGISNLRAPETVALEIIARAIGSGA